MEVSVTNQAYIFISAIVGGIIIGLLFDVFRILRKMIKKNNVLTYIEDILFWILATGITFALVFITNDGELRWFEFVGILLGVVFYHMVFSSFVIKIALTLIHIMKKVITVMIKIMLFPVVCIYKIFYRPVKGCIYIFKKMGKAIYCNVKRMLKKNLGQMRRAVKNVKKRMRKK